MERVVRTLPLALLLGGALAVGGCEGDGAARDAAAAQTVASQEPEQPDAGADGDSSGVTVQGPGRAIPKTGTSGPPQSSNAAPDGARGRARRDAGVGDAATGDAVGNDVRRDGPGAIASDMCGRINCDCTLRGVPLWGNVTFVLTGGDFKIRGTLDPDLFVQTTFNPTGCGQWNEVPGGADFTVQIVTTGEDFQVEFGLMPGVAKAPGTP